MALYPKSWRNAYWGSECQKLQPKLGLPFRSCWWCSKGLNGGQSTSRAKNPLPSSRSIRDDNTSVPHVLDLAAVVTLLKTTRKPKPGLSRDTGVYC
jgi:hypothetical protein